MGKLNRLDIFKVEEDGNYADTNTITKYNLILYLFYCPKFGNLNI